MIYKKQTSQHQRNKEKKMKDLCEKLKLINDNFDGISE